MGLVGFILLIAIGLAPVAVVRVTKATRYECEAVIAGLGVMIGAFFSNLFVRSTSAVGPEIDGLLLVPALIGGLTFGAIAGLVARVSAASTS